MKVQTMSAIVIRRHTSYEAVAAADAKEGANRPFAADSADPKKTLTYRVSHPIIHRGFSA